MTSSRGILRARLAAGASACGFYLLLGMFYLGQSFGAPVVCGGHPAALLRPWSRKPSDAECRRFLEQITRQAR